MSQHLWTGAEDDLKSVSKMAYLQIRQLGMNERIGLVSFPDPDGRGFSGEKPYSKQTAALIDEVQCTILNVSFFKTIIKNWIGM